MKEGKIMDTILIYIFVSIIYIFCLFCVGVIIKDLIDECKKDKKTKKEHGKENA